MKKHKNKIIAAVIILAALTGAWFFGGNYNKSEINAPPATAQTVENTIPLSDNVSNAQSEQITTGVAALPSSAEPIPTASANTTTSVPSGIPAVSSTEPPVSVSPSTAADPPTYAPSSAPPNETPPESSEPTAHAPDNYITDPVPVGKPQPVEPQDAITGDGSFTVTLTVRCDTILDNMNLLNKEKHELVPADGVIFPTTAITVYEGESVFNALQREMRRARIHMTHRNTPIYNSAYVEAINNLYEFDVGELSGWMYKVNGWYPNYGCSRYQLQPGDVVEWHYSCDLGRDLEGASWAVFGRQADD